MGRRFLPMTVGLALFAVALGVVPVFGRPPLPAVAGSYLLSGFLVGSPLLALSIVKERYPAGGSGVATATVNMAGFVGAAVFPTLMGLALDAYRTGEVVGGSVVYTEFGYRVAFAILAGSLVVAFVCSAWLLVLERADRSA